MNEINKKFLLGVISVLVIGGLTGCSTNLKGEDKVVNQPSAKVEEKVAVGEKQIPENYLKDIIIDHKTIKTADNEGLVDLLYNSMRGFDEFNITSSLKFTSYTHSTDEYLKGNYLFYRGENAKQFIVENFSDYGYNEDYINKYIANVDMTLDDLCFFLLRCDSMIDDKSQEIFKEGEFKDRYMIGFLTEGDNALTFEDMTTHEMDSFVSTAKAYK